MTDSKQSTNRRKFLTNLTIALGSVGTIFSLIPFLSSMSPSEKTKMAGAPVEVDVSTLKPGAFKIVEWRGKPVWVVRRTPEMLNKIEEEADYLSDPMSSENFQPRYAQNKYRSIKPEFLVLLGICTHLGCSPLYKPNKNALEFGSNWKGGFFCPCHGSTFDLSGRVYKGVPAPSNLEVPPYHFLSETVIVVGENGAEV
tara:strand:- start:848 stop:1441 length:594 start_codon:yes stop_codon:yes gene_type:complete